MQYDLMCGQSVRRQLAFGKFAEAAYCFAVLDFEHYSLTKARVLCQGLFYLWCYFLLPWHQAMKMHRGRPLCIVYFFVVTDFADDQEE